jgi:hypothetical protein
MLSGLITHQLERIAPFEKTLPQGCQALQFDRLHLAAILFALEAALGHFIVIEFAFDPLASAVEEVDGRPQEIVEVGFQAGVFEARNQGVEDVGDGASDAVAFGEWPGIRFVLKGSVAVELKLPQNVFGGGRFVVRFKVVVLVHRMLHRLDRALAAFMAKKPTTGMVLHP